jgi:hemoglobin/transferrin/lactoferrin receptor protein
MNKKYKKIIIVAPFLIPHLIYCQTTVLEQINVNEKKELKTNSIEIDLARTEQNQVNSFSDLFKKESSLEVGGGAINTQRIYLRGIESTNLNISLDGTTQGKNMFQHMGNELRVNPHLLKAVDINTSFDASKGGALGGSIEMTTKDAQDFASKDKKKGVILKSGYQTNTQSKIGSSTAYEIFDKNYGAVASISGINSDNYKDGNDERTIATAYKNRDYFAKFSMLDVKDNDLKITINENENSINSQWKGTDANPKPTDLEKIVSTTNNYAIQHNYNPNNLVDLDTDLNLSKINLNRVDKDKEYENEALGLKIQNHFNFDLANINNRFSLGGDIKNEEGKGSFDPHISDKNITKYSDVKLNNQALFMQNKTSINDLTFNYGLRFDDYSLQTGLGEATNHSFSPNIGLDYALDDNSTIYSNYGKSSRMTGIIPFTWLTNIKKDTTYSSKLEPETSTRYEVGYKYKTFDIFTNNDSASFDINIFKTNIEDLIVAKDVVNGSAEGGRTLKDIYNSSNEFETKGFELKALYGYDIYLTSLSYTQSNANTINDDTNGVTGVDESISIRRVGAYDTKKLAGNLGVELTKTLFVDYTINAISGIDEPIQRSGYVTHDISTKWKPSHNSPWTYFLAVNNLTDKYYANHSSIASKSNAELYRYEAGRDFRFAISYEF